MLAWLTVHEPALPRKVSRTPVVTLVMAAVGVALALTYPLGIEHG